MKKKEKLQPKEKKQNRPKYKNKKKQSGMIHISDEKTSENTNEIEEGEGAKESSAQEESDSEEVDETVASSKELSLADSEHELSSTDGVEIVSEKEDIKKFSRKKLPSLLKATYSEHALKSRILNKIYVPEDKDELRALFVLGGNPKKPKLYAVPQEFEFTKEALKRYKKLIKDVKRQRFRVRMVPLIAVIVLITAFVIVVDTFKNPLVKKGLTMGAEAAFGAKTDIGYVNLSIMSTRLTIGNIAIGNKNSYYKNLFEAKKIELDFDLVQALRGRFDAENLEVSGMDFNTDRTTSCELPAKAKTTKKEDSAFMKSLKAKSNRAILDLQAQAFDLLGGSDVDSIVANIQAQLKTPQAAQDALDEAQILIEKWKDKPAELTGVVTDFVYTVQDLQTINVKNYDDVEGLKDALKKVNAAVVSGNTIKETVEQVVEDVKEDAATVQAVADNVIKSAESDYNYAKERLTTLTGAVKNADALVNNALNTVGYDMMGKYYPYVVQGLNYATELKNKSSEKKKETTEEKIKSRKRLKGTTYWYMDACPAFLIERVRASGTNFEATLTEVTNDQNVRNKPTMLTGSLVTSGVDHRANITVDARSASLEPLVSVSYLGSGFNTNIDGTSIASKCGIPSITGKTVLSGTADATGFTAQGSLDINPVSLTTDGFANDFVTKYYRAGLSAIDRISMGYDLGYTEARGAYLDLQGNLGDQFMKALEAIILSIGRDAKNAALKLIEDQLNNSSNEVIVRAKEFLGIEGDIDLQNIRFSDAQALLEKKKAEIEKQIYDMVNGLINEAKQQVEAAVDEVQRQAELAAEEAKKQAEAAAEEARKQAEAAAEEAKKQAEEAAKAAAKEAEKQATDAVKDAIKDNLGVDSDQASKATDALKDMGSNALKGLFGR